MAVNKKQVLGKPTGRVGDVVYRNVNGKTVISEYVKTIKISKSKNCVSNRSRFAVCTDFAVAASSVNPINKIWKYSNALGRSAYTKLIKANIKSVDDSKPSSASTITPQGGIDLSLYNVAVSNNSITVEYKINRVAASGLLPPYTCTFLAFCFDKRSDNLEIEDDYFSITANIPNESGGSTDSVSFNINDYTKNCINSFKKARIYFAAVKPNAGSSNAEWSSTSYSEIDLPVI
ncbi:MAG: hypothetical protein WC644_06360 [Ignavibacteria bacterium]